MAPPILNRTPPWAYLMNTPLDFFQGGVFEIHIDQENDKNVKWTVISRKKTENPKIFGASRLN